MNKTFLILGALAAYLFYKHSSGTISGTTTGTATDVNGTTITATPGATGALPSQQHLSAMPSDATKIWGPYINKLSGGTVSVWQSPTWGYIKYNQTANSVFSLSQADAQKFINTTVSAG